MPNVSNLVVDEKSYNSIESQNLMLSPGLHTISVPVLIKVDNAQRLRFETWSDGMSNPNRTINLTTELNLRALYVTQFKLTLYSPWSTSGEGWYDQGSTASFSTTWIPFMPLTLQWYDETGTSVGSSTGTIRMDRPHVLQAKWNVNYVFLGIDVLIAFMVLAFFTIGKDTAHLLTVTNLRTNAHQSQHGRKGPLKIRLISSSTTEVLTFVQL
jgi:hypothetical protein